MKTTIYESKEAWLKGREGRITGSSLKEVIPTGGPTKEMIVEELEAEGIEFKKADKKEILEALVPASSKSTLFKRLPKKIGFFKLIAHRLGVPEEDESTPMDRGSKLESEAVEKFCKTQGKKMDTRLAIWSRDDNDSIAISPDAFEEVPEGDPITEAVEVKCLGSANHIKAWYYQEVPDDYWYQVLQYFIVNPDLKKLFFVMYDPRISAIEFVVIEITREQVQAQVDEFLEYERMTLVEVNDIVNKLTF